MGLFDFVENFFFISLGITFALILLLVYHFKQRISSMERKGDTMFELLTNVVKELQCMKGINNYYESFFESRVSSANPIPSGCPYTPEKPPSEESEKRIIDLSIDESCPFVSNMNVVKHPDTKIVVSDDEDSDSDSDESEDSDDSDDSASDSDESEYSEVIENVNVEVGDIEPVEIEMTDLRVPAEEISEVVSESVPEVMPEVIQEVVPETIPEVVSETIPETIPEAIPEVMPTQDTSAQGPEEPTKSQKHDVYLKMNITQLKTLAVSVGIRQDISKMKKKDLIQLLESLDE